MGLFCDAYQRGLRCRRQQDIGLLQNQLLQHATNVGWAFVTSHGDFHWNHMQSPGSHPVDNILINKILVRNGDLAAFLVRNNGRAETLSRNASGDVSDCDQVAQASGFFKQNNEAAE